MVKFDNHLKFFKILAQLYISTVMASSLTYSASPIFFEFSVEIVYPVPEGVVGGFLTLVYNTFGMIFLFLFYVPAIGKNNRFCIIHLNIVGLFGKIYFLQILINL